jgi:hypothetical protein
MQALSRRAFVASTLMGVGAVAIGGAWINREKSGITRLIRLLPVDGVTYPDSFLVFIGNARFSSVRDAVFSIRDRSLPVSLGVEICNGGYAHLPRQLGTPKDCNGRRTGNSRTAAKSSSSAHPIPAIRGGLVAR